jgi:outer membrane lipoprotein-sorting protein
MKSPLAPPARRCHMSAMRTIFLILLLALATVAEPTVGQISAAHAQGASKSPSASPATPVFSPDQLDAIQKVEDYLNDITTLQSSFVQGASTGQSASGTFYLQRPGKMRFEYEPPSPILLVADGLFLTYIDKELKEINRLPLISTPLSVLVASRVDLSGGDLEVFAVNRTENTIRLALRDRKDRGAGAVSLTFTTRPMQLRQWTVVDAQGVEVRVALLDPRTGVDMEPKLFIVDDGQFQVDRGR